MHLHSEYSLLDGAARIADIPAAAVACGHRAAAITDHGAMYGVVAFQNACESAGIKPIFGCEVYVAPGSRFGSGRQGETVYYHLVLLAKNAEGYRNLIALVSAGFTEGFYSKPRVDMELLRAYSGGIIALSGCLAGYIPRALIRGDFDDALNHAREMRGIFGAENYYIELQNHGLSDQLAILPRLVRVARECGIGLAATNDVHYLRRSDAETQAVLMCIQMNEKLADGRPSGFEGDEFYYKSTEQMAGLFADYPEAIENTVKIAEMCNFKFEFNSLKMPKFTIAGENGGKGSAALLRSLVFEGLDSYAKSGKITFSNDYPRKVYADRAEYELAVIEGMGYADYFLIVHDYVAFAKRSSIPVGPGRGSSAGSLAAYLLSITDVDPIRGELLFERFLNPERVSMPDIDIDFCYERRDEVIGYVRERYGADHVAQIVTFSTLAARAAVWDAGRALGIPLSETDRITKLIGGGPGVTIADALENAELREIYDSSDGIRRLIDTASALEGMPRNMSVHAAGVVITDRPVSEYMPLAVSNGVTITQFDMDAVTALGFLKFDFLALRYLTIINDAQKQVRERLPGFDITRVDPADRATYRMISEGRTGGVFQLESAGMRQVLTALKPGSLNDILAAIALHRPGPMDSIPKYIEGKNNPGSLRFKIPRLAPILASTFGCIVYQEQVMQIFRELAGYTYGRADIVRRAMAKKKAGVMEAERVDFIRGCTERGMDAAMAEQLFDQMSDFANYAFPKSHAAAYAVISFRTAYMKTHHFREYMAALLTSALGNNAKIAEYIAECGKFNVKVFPPDINRSRVKFHVVDAADGETEGGISFGLLALKNVGRQFLFTIIAERTRGNYTSFEEFIKRMPVLDLNKRQVEYLIKAGAFDSLGVYRSRLLDSFERMIDIAAGTRRQNIEGQLDMFGGGSQPDNGKSGKTDAPGYVYSNIPELSMRDRLALEKECSGLYFSGHLLDEYRLHADSFAHEEIKDIIGGEDEFSDECRISENSRRVALCGIVTSKKNKTTKKGEAMAFITLEDKTAEVEVIVFPNVFLKYSRILYIDSAVYITGNISVRDGEDVKIILDSAVKLLDDPTFKDERNRIASASLSPPSRLYLRVPSRGSGQCSRALNLIEIFPGKTDVYIYETESRKYSRITGAGTDAGEFLLRELRGILGEENVTVK